MKHYLALTGEMADSAIAKLVAWEEARHVRADKECDPVAYDPLSVSTRRTRKALIGVSAAAILTEYFRLKITNIPASGISIATPDTLLSVALSAAILYFMASFIVQFYDDYSNRPQPYFLEQRNLLQQQSASNLREGFKFTTLDNLKDIFGPTPRHQSNNLDTVLERFFRAFHEDSLEELKDPYLTLDETALAQLHIEPILSDMGRNGMPTGAARLTITNEFRKIMTTLIDEIATELPKIYAEDPRANRYVSFSKFRIAFEFFMPFLVGIVALLLLFGWAPASVLPSAAE